MHVREVARSARPARQQVMVHPLIMLADDVQARVGQQVMDVGDAAGDRVLDRDHRQAGETVVHAAKASSNDRQGRWRAPAGAGAAGRSE